MKVDMTFLMIIKNKIKNYYKNYFNKNYIWLIKDNLKVSKSIIMFLIIAEN